MKLDLDCKSSGRVAVGDIVTIRNVCAYARGRESQNGKYATIYRTAKQVFDTGNGALDGYVRDKRVKEVINDGNAVVV
jgi:hypothetical protein